jgi:hypothetical protein
MAARAGEKLTFVEWKFDLVGQEEKVVQLKSWKL